MTTRRSIRGIIGKQQLRGTLNPWEQAYTRSIRKQMEQIETKLSKVVNYLEGDAAEIAIRAALEPIFAKSQVYVPVDTGELKASGYLEIGRFRGRPRGVVGYAPGGDPEYAVIVHEDLEAQHDPPTRAKFLEAAFKEEEPNTLDRVLRSMRQSF